MSIRSSDRQSNKQSHGLKNGSKTAGNDSNSTHPCTTLIYTPQSPTPPDSTSPIAPRPRKESPAPVVSCTFGARKDGPSTTYSERGNHLFATSLALDWHGESTLQRCPSSAATNGMNPPPPSLLIITTSPPPPHHLSVLR